MDVAQSHTSGRLVRALIAGGLLAAAWFVTDSVLSAEPVAAAGSVEIIPGGETPIGDLLDTMTTVVTVATPIIAPVTSALEPVAATVDAAVAPLAPVTSPVLAPGREATQPVVDTVVSPLLEGTIDVLAPVIAPVVVVVAPVVETPIVETAAAAVPTAVVAMSTSGGMLLGDSGSAVSVALLGAMVVGGLSALPGGPLSPAGRSPLSPDSTSSFSAPSLLADAFAGLSASFASSGPPNGALRHPHASPVFASDTTPD